MKDFVVCIMLAASAVIINSVSGHSEFYELFHMLFEN
jgi:hypothetical protein